MHTYTHALPYLDSDTQLFFHDNFVLRDSPRRESLWRCVVARAGTARHRWNSLSTGSTGSTAAHG